MPKNEHPQPYIKATTGNMSTPPQPYNNQVYLNRIFLLQIFSDHYDLTHTPNELITNVLATGGQIQTDISIIESETQQDLSRAQVLQDGFYNLYEIEFGSANDLRLMPRLGEMADVYAGLQITDCLGNGCERMNEVIMEGWNEYWDKRPAVLGFDWKFAELYASGTVEYALQTFPSTSTTTLSSHQPHIPNPPKTLPPSIDINELASQLHHLASRFDYLACMLAPSTDEVYVIRTSILLDFAYPAPNPNPQYRDPFANGGQLVTDMAIIKHESDPYNVADFKAGFANLYGIEYHEGIRGFPKVVRIANVHADLLTMGDLGLGRMDRDRYVRLARMVLGCWGRVVEYGDGDGVFTEGVPLDLEDVYWDVVYGVRGLRG